MSLSPRDRSVKSPGPFVLGIIAVIAIVAGVLVRSWAYNATAGLRFQWDVGNAWQQGHSIVAHARDFKPGQWPSMWEVLRSYVGRYDAVISEHPDGSYILDYAPLRLLISTLWVWTTGEHATAPPDQLAGPLLDLNTGLELATAAMAYLLVRRIIGGKTEGAARWPALAAGLLIWFDPAVIIDAHVWPQWDIWPTPFILLGAYLAIDQRWLAAGLALGLAAMLKAQILLVAPFFLLWPLFQNRPRAALEVAAGIALAISVIISPWMLQTAGAAVFVVACGMMICVCARWIPRGWRGLAAAASVAGSLPLAGAWFGGSFGWWKIGFVYGANKFDVMSFPRVPNFPRVVNSLLGWTRSGNLATVNLPGLHLHPAVTARVILAVIYVAGLIPVAFRTARHDARGDRGVLLTLGVPWLLMFTFLPQMQPRYLIWAAVFSALPAGISGGWAMIHAGISMIASTTIVYTLLFHSAGAAAHPHWLAFLTDACNVLTPINIVLTVYVFWLALRPIQPAAAGVV
jgi:hypothetical protein